MSRKLMAPVFLAVLLFFAVGVSANEYFVFDHAQDKLSIMGADMSGFVEKVSLETLPNLIIRTNEPQRYLALTIPVADEKGRYLQAGAMEIFNANTGQVEAKVQLGYGPFYWTMSKDRRHFFIGYRLAVKEEESELLHYDMTTLQAEKTDKFPSYFNGLALAADESKLFVIISCVRGTVDPDLLEHPLRGTQKKPGKVLVYQYGPLKLQGEIPVRGNPVGFHILGADRFVLIDKVPGSMSHSGGSIKIVNSADYQILEEKVIASSAEISDYWYESEKTLLIIADDLKTSVYKITAAGIIKYSKVYSGGNSTWKSLYYFKDKESIYILRATDIRVLDCKTGSVIKCNTNGANVTMDGVSSLERLPESDLAVVYNEMGGKVKFIDLNQNKLVKSLNYGRSIAKMGNLAIIVATDLFLTFSVSYLMSPSGVIFAGEWIKFKRGVAIALTPDRSRVYVLSRKTRDITVFNQNYQKISYIVPPEAPQTLYQITGGNHQTLVLTSKSIYRINEKDQTLTPIHEFNKPVKFGYFFDDGQYLVVVCDKELLFLNPATLEVKQQFAAPDKNEADEGRLKKGEIRYNFVPAF